jgi:1-acyl-sn-glycerol-3-phosphate acyltransferase
MLNVIFMNAISALLKFTQPVLVKREDPNSRQNTVKEIQNRAQVGGWPQILIFPEGTCTNRSCLISFKLGTIISLTLRKNEPRHDKTNIVRLRPAWIQTSLGIRAV